MKQLIKVVFFLFFIGLFLPSKGQDLLIRGGLNLASVSTGDADELKNNHIQRRPAGYFALIYEVGLSKSWSLETGLAYSGKGYSIEEAMLPGAIVIFSETVYAHYLEVPLMLRYAYHFNNQFQFFGSAGLYGGYDPFWSLFAQENRFDAGFTVGAGLEYQRFQFGCYYNLGLINSNVYSGNIDSYNQVLSFLLSYRFPQAFSN